MSTERSEQQGSTSYSLSSEFYSSTFICSGISSYFVEEVKTETENILSILDDKQGSVSSSTFFRFSNESQSSSSSLVMDENKSEQLNSGTAHHRAMSWTGSTTAYHVPGQQPQQQPNRQHQKEFKFSPVCRASYSSMPQTSAVMFLASLAEGESLVTKSPTELNQGSMVKDYVVGKVIGRGAYSHCREGTKKSDPWKKFALKIVQNEGVHDTIEHEIDIWSRLKHPGFLPLLDIIRLHDITIIVSPMAEYGSMLKYLQNNGPMSEPAAKRIFKELTETLRYLHLEQRIVHHDIKLENILLSRDMSVHVCDFGLSEFVDEHVKWCLSTSSQEDLMMKGSLWYLPPEVIDCTRSRRHSITKAPQLASGDWKLEKTKLDIWALGVVLYAMVTGSLPFTHDYLPKLQQSILSGDYPPLDEEFDDQLCDLISQLLRTDPEARPLISQVLEHPWLL